MVKKLQIFFLRIKFFLEGVHIPFLGISIWQIFVVYYDSIFKNPLGRQAASISWNFFLSLFPMVLFFLSVLPFMPHYDKLHFYIFQVLMPRVFPSHMQSDIASYIQENIIPNMKSISNLTILISFIFATKGCFTLINGFNKNTELKRTFIEEYLLSMLITICFISAVCLSIFGIYYSEVVLKLFRPSYDITWLINNLSIVIGFVSFPLFYFVLLTLFYWIGCLKITRIKEAIPGAVLTTLFFVLLTYLFTIYAAHIARYNILYGSIGSIILMMIWVNINVFTILMGNELNIAIKSVKLDKVVRDDIDYITKLKL